MFVYGFYVEIYQTYHKNPPTCSACARGLSFFAFASTFFTVPFRFRLFRLVSAAAFFAVPVRFRSFRLSLSIRFRVVGAPGSAGEHGRAPGNAPELCDEHQRVPRNTNERAGECQRASGNAWDGCADPSHRQYLDIQEIMVRIFPFTQLSAMSSTGASKPSTAISKQN